MNKRVVITGLGIISPNANNITEYEHALKNSISGLRFVPKMEENNFRCHVGGIPQNLDELKKKSFYQDDLLAMNDNMIYACLAALECWRDAGLPIRDRQSEVDWETGAIIGTGIGGMDTITGKLLHQVDGGKVRRLGSTLVEQVMSSAPSAKLGGILGLGGQVTTNSSACTTGTEAIVEAFLKIREGRLNRVLAGGTEGSSHYIWAGFDSMRVLNSQFNAYPSEASRPMSERASGFIPSSGAGILMLESLESAQNRGARIYAEITGGHINSGGHRNGGSMTAPNPIGVIKCIRETLVMGKTRPQEIDTINGHLTATFADPMEIDNWIKALEITPNELPLINSTKSLIGHGLGAAGGMECVASVLEVYKGFIHGSANCEDVHPKLNAISRSIVHKTINKEINTLIKASFGFGDVNACILLKKWNHEI